MKIAYTTGPKSSGMPTVAIEYIGPKEAAKMLEGNTENYRSLSKSKVARYAGDQTKDLWSLTTDGIGIDVNEIVTNGQHRLYAILKSGRTLPFVVVRGLPAGAAADPNQDTGARRSVATHLVHNGVQNANNVAAAARFLWSLRIAGKRKSDDVKELSDAMIAKIVAGDETLIEAASRANAISKIAKPSIAASWLWLVSFEDKSLAYQCIEIMAGRIDSSTTHPFVKLRECCLQHRVDHRFRGGMTSDLQFRYMMSAWDKAKNNTTVKLLRPANTIKISDAADEALQLMGL